MLEDFVNTLQRLAEVLQRERALGVALARIAEAATRSVVVDLGRVSFSDSRGLHAC